MTNAKPFGSNIIECLSIRNYNFGYVRKILLINNKKTIVIKSEYDRRESLKTK